MEIDIIEVTEEQLNKFSAVQWQLLRTAQKNKNKLKHNLETDMEIFKKTLLANNTRFSSVYEQKLAALTEEYEYEVEILKEQLLYSLSLGEPYPSDEDLENIGYIVDWSLTYNERYRIVRDYYLAISDPSERMALYANDEVAKKYLSSYYITLYDVLSSYSR